MIKKVKIKFVKLKKCQKCKSYECITHLGLRCAGFGYLLPLWEEIDETLYVIGCPKQIEKALKKSGK